MPAGVRLGLASAPLTLLSASIAADAAPADDPMRFFEGRTEYISTMKIVARKPYRSRTMGFGRINSDGSLHLVQKVQDEGKVGYERRWHIRRIGPGRFGGTMSEAKGPVTVEQVAGNYRFRFRMKGNLAIEQWLTPLPGGHAARSRLTVRKLGVTVGRSEGSIRKI